MKKEHLRKLIEEAKADVAAISLDAEKFLDKDNQAAGTRVRTGASALTKKLKEIRVAVQEVKNS